MSDLKIYKEIGGVTSNFGADSIYAIRTGPGFDLYLTDTTGSVAFKQNKEKLSAEAGNILESKSDGVYAEIPVTSDVLSFINALDSGISGTSV